MRGLRRRRTASKEAAATITADLSGAVIQGGQVAVGENITQFYAEAGAVVNYSAPREQQRPRLRPLPVQRLPRDFPGLLGREEQVGIAKAAFSSGSPVEFFGEPGIGKSALLRHLAHHADQRPSEGTIHHASAGEPLEDSLQFVFECFYECETTLIPTPAQLREYLQERRALLIFDDVELERDDLERLMDVLSACSLLTASTQRHLWGEGQAIELGGLDEREALALVEGEIDRPLSGEEREAVRTLWSAVVGNPLRLLQAGAEMRRGLAAARLADTVTVEPGTLDSSLVGSLSPGDRLLLEPLAALPAGSLHRDDLARLTGLSDARKRLKALEERALVQSQSPRYGLAAGLGDELLDEKERRRWRERLLAHFADRGDELPDSADGPTALALLEWAANDDERRPEALRLVRVLDKTFNLGGRWGSWRRALEAALVAARGLGDRAAEAWSLHQLGSRALCLGDTAAAGASLSAALELRETLGDHQGAAITRHNLELLSATPSAGHGRGRWLNPTILLAALALVAGTATALVLSQSNDSSPGPTAGKYLPPIPTQGSKPDLVVAIDTVQPVGDGGTPSCEITYTIANRGGGVAGQSITGIHFSTAALAIQDPSPVLNPGQAYQQEATVSRTRCPAAKKIKAHADEGGQVVESDEDNQDIPSTDISVTVPPTTSVSTTPSTTTTSSTTTTTSSTTTTISSTTTPDTIP